MRKVVGTLAGLAVAVGVWRYATRAGTAPPPVADVAAVAPTGAVDGVAVAAVPSSEPPRQLLRGPSDLEDFAPEQREAVRELLAAGVPDAAALEGVRAALARLRDDDDERRQIVGRELLPATVVVRADVLAVLFDRAIVHCHAAVPELGAPAGAGLQLQIGGDGEQVEILQRHQLRTEPVLAVGRVQALVLGRLPVVGFGTVVLAGPPRGEPVADAVPAPQLPIPGEPTLDEFGPELRGIAAELMAQGESWRRRSSFAIRGVLEPVGLHLVRCEYRHGRYRSLAAVPALGLEAGQVFDAMDTSRDVRRRYRLADDPPQDGEQRTLLVQGVWMFVDYKRLVWLASPPLPATERSPR